MADHLSISGIKLFKACRRAYEFRYIEGLIPVDTAESLQTGLQYHELLETLYKDGSLPEDFTKETAMAVAYQKYIYPKFKMLATEQWLKHGRFVGRADGIAADGSLVEHKTTSTDLELYEYSLQLDEQILMYMFLSGIRKVYYTIIRKPTIRQKKNESDEEFYNRMVAWYDEDTDTKIRVLEITRTDEEVREFMEQLVETAVEMDECRLYYRNTMHCQRWGRLCEYASICMHYNPHQQYAEFIRKEERDAD